MTQRIPWTVLAVSCAVLTATGIVEAATNIDTTMTWAGGTVGYWGEPPTTATHGQTFTVGSDNRLDNFTFYVAEASGSEHVDFRAYIQEWNPATSRAMGPLLFQSSTVMHTTIQDWESFTVDTSGLLLVESKQYVAFFSTSLVDTGDGRAWVGYAGETYAPGTFVYINNGTDFSALTNTAWVTDYPGGDLAFKMSFNVPEPATGLIAFIASVWLLGRPRPPRRGLDRL